MSSITIALCVILPILALVVSVWASIRCMDKPKSGKKAFGRQLLVLGVALTVAFSCMGVAYAAEDGEPVPETAVTEVAEEETQSDGGIAQGLSFIGAALAIGLAAIGAGIEEHNMGEFPSGQRGQTVNLLRFASMVRIRPPPPTTKSPRVAMTLGLFLLFPARTADGKQGSFGYKKAPN